MLPPWDESEVGQGDPYAIRGKRHGRYCGWGHTAPLETAPVDQVDAICREHDASYSEGTTRSQRCAADARFRRRMAQWLDTHRATAPPRMVEKVEAMRKAIGTAAFLTCFDTDDESDAPAVPPHPSELDDATDGQPVTIHPSGVRAPTPALSPDCLALLADQCEEAAESWEFFQAHRLLREAEILAGV